MRLLPSQLLSWCVGVEITRLWSLAATVQDSDNDPHLPNMPLNEGQPNAINIIKPELQWCTCGIWQDVLYPCRHGCAVFWKLKEKDVNYVLQNFGASLLQIIVRTTHVQNKIFPACIDNVKYNDITRAPIVKIHSQGGAPKKQTTLSTK